MTVKTSPEVMKSRALMPVSGCECSLALAHCNVAILQSFAVLMISKPSVDSSMPHAGRFSLNFRTAGEFTSSLLYRISKKTEHY